MAENYIISQFWNYLLSESDQAVFIRIYISA